MVVFVVKEMNNGPKAILFSFFLSFFWCCTYTEFKFLKDNNAVRAVGLVVHVCNQ